MRARSDEAARAAIGAAARELRLPTIRSEASRLAEIAARERQSYLARVSNDHGFVALIMMLGFAGWWP